MSAGFLESGADLGIAVRLARIVGVDANNQLLVDFEANPFGPLPALSTVLIQREMLSVERQALIVFSDGDPERPVIIGLIQENPVTPLPNIGKVAPRTPLEVSADGQRLTLEAYSELHLRCGDSSITLRKDGKVLIQGKHILSKATVCNRIKGGAVHLN